MAGEIKGFNIRVYALIINKEKQILLSDEFQLGMKMTKFPGGGLKAGEGTIDCLKREAMEEFGQEIEVLDHYYTLDYFQPSIFYSEYQLISIYYKAQFTEKIKFEVSERPFDIPELKNGSISFRWKSLTKLKEEDMTLPVDKKVVRMLNVSD
ncbi:MAG: NUDIX domain-containing protein [Bacteroidales bacterium]